MDLDSKNPNLLAIFYKQKCSVDSEWMNNSMNSD